MFKRVLLTGLLVAWLAAWQTPAVGAQQPYDVLVYGGTASGVMAAVQVRRMGKTVVLIEPGRHLGGLTSGGLGATDIGNKAAIGGLSREFYRRVQAHYQRPESWRQQRPEQYRSNRQSGNEDTMWTFEPHVAERILNQFVAEADVPVVFHERLDRSAQPALEAGRIVSIQMESGRRYRARCFIDASYEGDLLAAAGVSFHVGREANAAYDETLNGVQTRQAVKHQLQDGVDPYVESGNPDSGLLPGVHDDGPGQEGSEDRRVQAYCFRMCLTDDPDNRIPFEKPEDYDPLRYELLLRNFEAGENRIPWSPTPMPNRKTDTNNNYGFSTDNINMNYDWPTGDYATRQKIFEEHLSYQRGLMWTLANHPRVPEAIRREVSRWGCCKDEFPEHQGWSHQLYVREARRMVSDYVMTQHNCQGRTDVDDSVGLAAYTMDSHNVQRYVDSQGFARNEGDVQVGGFPPYKIAYRSLVPARRQCTNLLVPVCLSASHIAYGSIRMEPVFMVLGQSAATAACLALDAKVDVQSVDIEQLQQRLLQDGQVLEWTGPRPTPVVALDAADIDGIVVDDDQARLSGDWTSSRSVSRFVGAHYLHDNNEGKGRCQARFVTRVPRDGLYEVRLAYTAHANRATNVPVRIEHAEGQTDQRVNQRTAPPIDNAFMSLGKFRFQANRDAAVVISNTDTDGHVIVDAAIWVPVME